MLSSHTILRFKFSIIHHTQIVNLHISSTAIYLFPSKQTKLSFSLSKKIMKDETLVWASAPGWPAWYVSFLSHTHILSGIVSKRVFTSYRSLPQARDHQVFYWFFLQTWVSCKFHVRPSPSLSPHSHSLTHTHNTHRGENTYVPVSELASKPVPFLPISSLIIEESLSHSSLSKTYRKKLIVAIVKAIDQSGVTSFPPSLPKEIVSNLSLSRRKSSRSRTSRLIQVGKHSVLRENDYDMENGITTISGSVQSQQLRDVVRLSSSLLLPLSLSNITTSHSNTSRYDLVPHLIFFVWTRCLLSK